MQQQKWLKMSQAYFHLNAERDTTWNVVDKELEARQWQLMERELVGEQRDQWLDELRVRRMGKLGEGARMSLEQAVRDNPQLVMLGDPGAGKTTLLKYLAYQHAKMMSPNIQEDSTAVEVGEEEDNENVRLSEPYLPIYVRIAEYAEQRSLAGALALPKYLSKYQGEHTCKINLDKLQTLFEAWLDEGKCIVLLDGLDEITSTGEREDVNQSIYELIRVYAAKGNRFVITSRPAGYRVAPLFGDYQHYKVREMERPEIERFLRKWCYAAELAQAPEANRVQIAEVADEQIEAILNDVDTKPGVAKLAANPLLLTVIALIRRSGIALPERRSDLYATAVMTLVRRWDFVSNKTARQFMLDGRHGVEVLSPIAYCMHANRESGTVAEPDLKSSIARRIAKIKGLKQNDRKVQEEVEDFIERVRLSSGLFLERATRRYGFMHLTFEEYFAARYILARPSKALELMRQHLHDPRWEEVILLALGYHSRDFPQQASEMLYKLCLDPARPSLRREAYEHVFHRDLLFALKAVSDGIELRPQARLEQLIKDILNIYLDRVPTGGTGRYLTLQEQIQALLSSLRGFSKQLLIKELLARTDEDNNPNVRGSAARTLGNMRIPKPEVVDKLMAMLGDADPSVRSNAAIALGNSEITKPEVVDKLMALLNDADTDVRSNAAIALGNSEITKPEVVDKLMAMLGDADPSVRSNAAIALGNSEITNPQMVDKLMALLDDADTDVQGNVAMVLGNIDITKPEMVDKLMAMLDDADPRIRGRATLVLGIISTAKPEVVDKLMAMLDDTDPNVRMSSASALGNSEITKLEVVNKLMAMLDDADPAMQLTAASALGNMRITKPEVVDNLVAMLDDTDPHMRMRSAFTLGNNWIRKPEVVDKLAAVLDDTDPRVQVIAAFALGNMRIRKPEVVDKLVAMLDDADPRVRMRSAYALAETKIAIPTAVQSLLPLLADSNARVAAFMILSRSGAIHMIEVALLHQLLTHESWEVRRTAIQVLGRRTAIEKEEIIELILPTLKDNDESVRVATIKTLQRLLPVARVKKILYALVQEHGESGSDYRRFYDEAYDALYAIVNKELKTSDTSSICRVIAPLSIEIEDEDYEDDEDDEFIDIKF